MKQAIPADITRALLAQIKYPLVFKILNLLLVCLLFCNAIMTTELTRNYYRSWETSVDKKIRVINFNLVLISQSKILYLHRNFIVCKILALRIENEHGQPRAKQLYPWLSFLS